MPHTIYTINQKRVKSVTTIINDNLGWNKQVLIGWTRKNCLNGEDSLKILKEAGKIGTLAHKMIEGYILGEQVILDNYTPFEIAKAKTAYYGFYDWYQKNKNIKFIENELKLTSKKYLFGGTLDCIIKKSNRLILLDFKTSNSCHKEYIIQLAAYQKMYEENFNKKITSAIILMLDKEERKYIEHKISLKQLNWGWKVFESLLNLQKLKLMENTK